MSDTAKCVLCGEPMPAGEEIFNFHGYSGDCPKPPLPKQPVKQKILGLKWAVAEQIRKLEEKIKYDSGYIEGQNDSFAELMEWKNNLVVELTQAKETISALEARIKQLEGKL